MTEAASAAHAYDRPMGLVGDAPILLHAATVIRSVELGGVDAAACRRSVTERIGALVDDPPALVLTGSCSNALDATAALLLIEPGDEVVVPAFSFPTSVTPFLSRGAVLRFADVSADTANIEPASVLARVGERTRAVIGTHYAGIGFDVDALAPMLADRGIDLVEDAAHGLFARAGGTALGRFGRFGTLSFHRTKNLTSLEGGALIVNDPADVRRVQIAVDKGTNRVAFDAGEVDAYEWSGLGSSWRMSEGAVRYLGEELPRATAIQRRRHEVWARYERELAGWAVDHGVTLPVVPPDRESPAHLFFLVLPDGTRDSFVHHCAHRGVQAARHYGSLPDSPFGALVARPGDECPNARLLGDRLVRIPLHHDLDDACVDRVVGAVTSWEPSSSTACSRS